MNAQRNIAELRRLADELDELSAELYMFLKLAPVLMVVAGPTHFLRVNRYAVEFLGHTEQELTARPWANFIHPDDADASIKAAEEARGNGQPILSYENRYRRADGSYARILWAVSIWDERQICYAVGKPHG